MRCETSGHRIRTTTAITTTTAIHGRQEKQKTGLWMPSVDAALALVHAMPAYTVAGALLRVIAGSMAVHDE